MKSTSDQATRRGNKAIASPKHRPGLGECCPFRPNQENEQSGNGGSSHGVDGEVIVK